MAHKVRRDGTMRKKWRDIDGGYDVYYGWPQNLEVGEPTDLIIKGYVGWNKKVSNIRAAAEAVECLIASDLRKLPTKYFWYYYYYYYYYYCYYYYYY